MCFLFLFIKKSKILFLFVTSQQLILNLRILIFMQIWRGKYCPPLHPHFFHLQALLIFPNILEHFLMTFFLYVRLPAGNLNISSGMLKELLKIIQTTKLKGSLTNLFSHLKMPWQHALLLSAPKERRMANLPIHWCQINARTHQPIWLPN